MTALTDAAWAAYAAGLCIVPPREDGSKAPGGLWKRYQSERPDRTQMQVWYGGHNRTGVGVVCGAISGNLEPIDIDEREVWPAFQERMQAAGLGALLERITQGYSERSPNGFHLVYRCSEIAGNTVLAQRRNSDGSIKTLIETRGEGGYLIIAPSNGKVHPSGQGYELINGSFDTIATITPIERKMLWVVAQSFDEPLPPPPPEEPRERLPVGSQTRPGDDFNARARWSDILTLHGWELIGNHGSTGLWRRPGKDEGLSATTNHLGFDRLYVFSTSTELDAQKWYDKFQAYTFLTHNGDFAAAATALAKDGYGSSTKPSVIGNGTRPEPYTTPLNTSDPTPEPENPYAHSLIDWSTFWDADQIGEEWLIEPFLPRGRSIALYSPAKVGKSLLALDVAARAATGLHVLDQSATTPIEVCYYDFEMTMDDVRERLEEMGYGPETDLSHLHYYLLPSLPPLDTEAGGQAVRLICNYHHADLAIIDTTSRVLGGKENDADTMRAFYQFTGLLLKTDGVTLLRLDHAGKDSEKGQRGSSAKNDDVDLVWELTKQDGDLLQLRATHRRQAWIPETVVLLRKEEPTLHHERVFDSWPAGTTELALQMDRMGIPLNYGNTKVRRELHDNGVAKGNALIAAAIRYRKQRRVADEK